MGFFSSGSAEGPYANIPDEQLNFYQRHSKKWQSNAPFPVSSGGEYGVEAKCGIDGRLRNSLGLTNIDDLFEMKAPNLYGCITHTSDNIITLCKYVYEHLPNNNKYQQLHGKYDELQKRCVAQENTIKELMEQNKTLIKQNQELQDLLIPAKQKSAAASFAR
mgnify:CR=1 FL=1